MLVFSWFALGSWAYACSCKEFSCSSFNIRIACNIFCVSVSLNGFLIFRLKLLSLMPNFSAICHKNKPDSFASCLISALVKIITSFLLTTTNVFAIIKIPKLLLLYLSITQLCFNVKTFVVGFYQATTKIKERG